MRSRICIAALCAGISALFVATAVAGASPVTVDVRVEGATQTLFEGPVLVEPHGVLASSDTNEKLRRCDGINSLDPQNTVPAPTATSAAADAMTLIGETFDGKWYDGYQDYFVTRFGPDAETGSRSWGILVNNALTNVGGCQTQLDAGDEVLWVYNAFNGRPKLALFPAGAYSSGTRPLTATATLNQPFGVEVVSYTGAREEAAPPHPERTGSTAYSGAEVAPVTTNAKGFERVDTASAATVTTDSSGQASVTFTTPGWHRIKATVPGSGLEDNVIRSNRLDVCVPAEGQSGCGAPPADDAVRVPPATVGEVEIPESPAPPLLGGPATPITAPTPSPAPPAPAALRVSVPKLDRSELGRGRVGVSWKVLDPGVGVGRWTISSQTLGRKGAKYVQRATGTGKTAASVRLPGGASYRLRFTIADVLGQSSSTVIGKVVVPGGKGA